MSSRSAAAGADLRCTRRVNAAAASRPLTVSPSQAEWARNRIADAGLSDRIEVRLQDYRDVEGTFDKIASIEMFEGRG